MKIEIIGQQLWRLIDCDMIIKSNWVILAIFANIYKRVDHLRPTCIIIKRVILKISEAMMSVNLLG